MSWTDERIDRLKAMWSEGATASQIAEDLGGVSRNAVIGKAHRLGLDSRPSPVKAGEEKKPAAAKAAAPAAAPAAAKPAAKAAEPKPAPTPRAKPAAPSRLSAKSDDDDGHDPVAQPTRKITPTDPSRLPQATLVPAREGADPSTIQYRSVGPGGFIRQGPGDTQAPIPPAPPRRLVPAKPSAEVADRTSLLDLNDRICRWPLGHPGEPDFHFCGEPSNPGFPYCVAHCGVAYQAQLPRRDRRPPPPLPYGGPRVR